MTDGGNAILELIHSGARISIQDGYRLRIPGTARRTHSSPTSLKVAEGMVSHSRGRSQGGARGSLKTLKVLLNGLETRGNAAGPGWKDEALKAVKNAKDEFKKAETAAKTLTDNEENLKKILEKLKKK